MKLDLHLQLAAAGHFARLVRGLQPDVTLPAPPCARTMNTMLAISARPMGIGTASTLSVESAFCRLTRRALRPRRSASPSFPGHRPGPLSPGCEQGADR